MGRGRGRRPRHREHLKSTVEIGTVVTSLTEIVADEENQKAFGETATAVMEKVAEIQLKNADDASKAEGFATGDKDEIKQLVTAAEGATKGVDLTDDEVDAFTEVCDFISTFVGEQLDEATADMGEKTPESVLTGIATVGAFGTTFVDEIEEDISLRYRVHRDAQHRSLASTVVVDFVAKGTVDTFPESTVADVFAAAANVDVSKVTVSVTTVRGGHAAAAADGGRVGERAGRRSRWKTPRRHGRSSPCSLRR